MLIPGIAVFFTSLRVPDRYYPHRHKSGRSVFFHLAAVAADDIERRPQRISKQFHFILYQFPHLRDMLAMIGDAVIVMNLTFAVQSFFHTDAVSRSSSVHD